MDNKLFSNLDIGDHFRSNGDIWVKKSTRTAQIFEPVEYQKRVFYFSKNEPVVLYSNCKQFVPGEGAYIGCKGHFENTKYYKGF